MNQGDKGERQGRTPTPRRFGSTEHLASEAVAAYVDGELKMNAYLRAAQHLSVCADCAAEVEAQRHASGALRRAAAAREVSMPTSLLGALSRIPNGELPGCRGEQRSATDSRRWPLRWRK